MAERRIIEQAELSRPFNPNGGHAFTASIPNNLTSSLTAGAVGMLLEDGAVLGPSDCIHSEIREQGNGRFSVWHSDLYFSSSDRSDCNANGRTYSLMCIDFSPNSALYQHARQTFSANDAALLNLIQSNTNINNTLFLNFFGYFNGITRALKRHRIDFPDFAVELGTGAYPYTAMRFLIEGTREFIANDIIEIQPLFNRGFLTDLRLLLGLVMPERVEMFDRLLVEHPQGNASFQGLQVHDRQPFESIKVSDGACDLIFSTSVLEHVMHPREVVEKMVDVLKPGGHAFHSIDLRDHRDFENPLAFLTMTDAEYAAINTENRLRASDWLTLFKEAGFTILECSYGAFKSASDKVHTYGFAPINPPWVNDQMRSTFAQPFRAKELVDLSTLNITLLCRKSK